MIICSGTIYCARIIYKEHSDSGERQGTALQIGIFMLIQHKNIAQQEPHHPFQPDMRVVFVVSGLLALLLFLPGASVLSHLQWLDSGICAQIAAHSFYPGGSRLPLCARNTGIYLGFLTTLITLYGTGRGRAQRLPYRVLVIILVAGVAAMAVDGFNSLLVDLGQPHLYRPNNLLRLATGLVTGLALALLFMPMLNRLIWCGYNEQRSIASWKSLALYIPALVACFFVVAFQAAWTLYPVALLSTAGVLTALSSLNLIVIVAVSKRDETFVSYRELLPFFALALLFAVMELLILAQGRFALLQLFGIPM